MVGVYCLLGIEFGCFAWDWWFVKLCVITLLRGWYNMSILGFWRCMVLVLAVWIWCCFGYFVHVFWFVVVNDLIVVFDVLFGLRIVLGFLFLWLFLFVLVKFDWFVGLHVVFSFCFALWWVLVCDWINCWFVCCWFIGFGVFGYIGLVCLLLYLCCWLWMFCRTFYFEVIHLSFC